MEYKGYFARVEFDDEANIFHGEVINLRDVITFEGESVDELRKAFTESVEDYLEFCAERGEAPEKPYSGKFLVRVGPELHKTLVIQARRNGKSLNTWVSDALNQVVKSCTQQ
ncbi:MAG: type II toxin-antitoxin system HicB family antitoxin [Thermodesulfobacteriota bacterium]|nr:type II toxin-antitoxin system HicB family antitoxin [Thermodesulfobacteriota bacterium]